MPRIKITLLISIVILLITISTIGQKSKFNNNRDSEHINMDSLIKVTIEKNEKTITKRISTLKNAEKAADSLSSVITVLKKENEQLHESIPNISLANTDDKFELLPISEN
jgi:hypothetical protein